MSTPAAERSWGPFPGPETWCHSIAGACNTEPLPQEDGLMPSHLLGRTSSLCCPPNHSKECKRSWGWPPCQKFGLWAAVSTLGGNHPCRDPTSLALKHQEISSKT